MPDYRSDHSTNVRVMSFRTTMTRTALLWRSTAAATVSRHRASQYIPAPLPGIAASMFFSGICVMTASMVSNSDAIDDEFSTTPLGYAAKWGNRDVVTLLLERGADPNKAGAEWATPLAWAKRKGRAEIASDLRRAVA